MVCEPVGGTAALRPGVSARAGLPCARGSFSLVELLLVMAMVAIIAAIAAPRYAMSAARYRADMAARRISADLAWARGRARTYSAARSVVFDVDDDEYAIPGIPDPDRPYQDYKVSLAEEPYRADIVSADFGGSDTVVFNGFGLPDNGGSVVIEVKGVRRTISLDQGTGEATVQ